MQTADNRLNKKRKTKYFRFCKMPEKQWTDGFELV